MRYLGIDTGGTFTDFLHVEGGRVQVRKLPSTPDDPGRVILDVLRARTDGGPHAWNADESLEVVHGSTVATNTLLERRGARCALVATRGFADVIEIGRQDRPRIYDLEWRPPAPLIPAEMRFEVSERVGPGGQVVERLTSSELGRLCAAVRESHPEAVAVGLLFSPENDAHELAIAEQLESLGVPIVLSSRVHPELREYERLSTTTISAYVTPAIDGYMERLSSALAPARFRVMESGGGVMRWSRLRGQAVRTVLSGPAGGVVAAARGGGGDRVSFDMGGTSTDVSLIVGGEIPLTRRFTIDGLPVAVPVVGVNTVGAGGGSESWIDAGGALRVGPRSAGATPGPICYGRGGTTPTVTDANYLLGRIPVDTLLGGEMPLVEDGVGEALRALGAPLGQSAVDVARGIVRVVEAEMERALRRITQERGVDPRRLALVSFGGAGGLHAVALARNLGMAQVRVPRDPGILSAAGMLLAPEVETSTRAVVSLLDDELLSRLGSDASTREKQCREQLLESRSQAQPSMGCTRELSLRFQGQSHELDIPWTDDDPRATFLETYRERYGFVHEQRAIEVVAARSTVSIPSELRLEPSWDVVCDARRRQTPVIFGGSSKPRPVARVQRAELAAGARLDGPAIVEEASSTLWLPAGARLTVDPDGTLLITPGRA